jgi:hypothetical protein
MAKVIVEFEVLNTMEIVKAKKGRFIGLVASLFMSEAKLKQKVEEKIKADLVEGLRDNLSKRLAEEGVSANIKVTAVDGAK